MLKSQPLAQNKISLTSLLKNGVVKRNAENSKASQFNKMLLL